MTFQQQIKRESLKGFGRVLKSVKNLESKQSHPILSVTATVSSPPTTAEINAAFDTPANVGTDFTGLIIDSTNGNEWQVWTDGSNWYVMAQSVSSNGIGARVTNLASYTIPDIITTELSFDTEIFDTSNFHSTTVNTGRFTIPADGIYMTTLQLYFNAGGAGNRSMLIDLVGSFPIAGVSRLSTAGVAQIMMCSTIYQFSQNDVIRALASQTSGGALSIISAPVYAPIFTIARVG